MYQGKTVLALIAAAGASKRMGGEVSKMLLPIDGIPVFGRTLQAMDLQPNVDGIYVSARPEELETYHSMARKYCPGKIRKIVGGGARRQDSIYHALLAMEEKEPADSLVLVHDGARPLVSQNLLLSLLETACEEGNAVPAMKITDTVKRILPEGLCETVDRSELVAVQTPQAFLLKDLLAAYRKAMADEITATDDASLVERMGTPIHFVEGEPCNLKITVPADLSLAEYYIRELRK